MKKTVANILALCSLGLVTACSTTTIEEITDDGYAIDFSSTLSRAAIQGNNFPDGSSFSVWGWYVNSNQETNNVFNNTEVKFTGTQWGYQGTQYWIPQCTYSFYAVHPTQASSDVSVSPSGEIIISDFDCSATGDAAKDLMTATSSRTYDGTDASAVSMQFSHLLAKIDFVGKNEGGNATVSKIELSNVYTQGTYTSSANPLWSKLISQSIVIDKSTILTPEGVTVSGDVLLIPQTLNNPQLTVTYSTDTETRTETYTLPVDMVSSWGAGQSYRYSFTVTGGGYIIFDAPTVNKWGTATGGNITIDVTEPNS